MIWKQKKRHKPSRSGLAPRSPNFSSISRALTRPSSVIFANFASEFSLCMNFQIASWPPAGPEIAASVAAAMARGDWGSYVSLAHAELTEKVAEFFQVGFVRLCSSGTCAVEMALRAANVNSGDEVITSAMDYPGNVRCIEAVGGKPSLVDVAAGGVVIDIDQVMAAASPRTRAVIASHLFGQPAPVAKLRKLCDERGWILIEDACQVPGMKIDQDGEPRSAGSYGHLGTLSFGGSKPLTGGNGGAVLTDGVRFHSRLKMLYDRPSDTHPLSALQAAAILPQLEHLARLNSLRNATVSALCQVAATRFPTWKLIHHQEPTTQSCHYKLAILISAADTRSRVVDAAKAFGIPLGEGFRSLHRMSNNRCRKSTLLEHSIALGERLCVLDHRALMIDPSRHVELVDTLAAVHDSTCQARADPT